MTPIESLLLLLDALAISAFLRTGGSIPLAGRILGGVTALVGLAVLVRETGRWQMYPAVLVAILIGIVSIRPPQIGTPGKLLAIFGYLLVLGSLAAAIIMPIFKLPTPTGPYSIGTNTREWTRMTPAESSAVPATGRRIVVQFWYPAEAGQRGELAPYRDAAAGTRFTKYLRLVETHAVLNEQVSHGQQKFPLLLFSPLWNSGRSPYATFYEELASQGFIVAAVEHVPDFPRDADELETPERMHELDVLATRRAQDLQFVLDMVTELTAKEGDLFAGKIDLNRVGALGHSFGGAASVEACFLDKRLKSAVDLDGALYGKVADNAPTQPVFYFISDGVRDISGALNSPSPGIRNEAKMEQIDRDRKIRSLHQSGGYYLRVRNSLHLDFTDRPLYSRLKRLTQTGNVDQKVEKEIFLRYTIAFFEQTLNGKSEPLLRAVPSPYPNVIFFGYPNEGAPYDPYSLSK